MTRTLLGIAPALVHSPFLCATPVAAGGPDPKEVAFGDDSSPDVGDLRLIALEIPKANLRNDGNPADSIDWEVQMEPSETRSPHPAVRYGHGACNRAHNQSSGPSSDLEEMKWNR